MLHSLMVSIFIVVWYLKYFDSVFASCSVVSQSDPASLRQRGCMTASSIAAVSLTRLIMVWVPRLVCSYAVLTVVAGLFWAACGVLARQLPLLELVVHVHDICLGEGWFACRYSHSGSAWGLPDSKRDDLLQQSLFC